jgi:hypothetical protein
MGGTGRSLAGMLAAAWLLCGSGRAAEGQAASYRRLMGAGLEAWSVRGAVQGAQKRLAREGCRRILDEFSDTDGRSLQHNLERLALTPGEYLDRLVFYDAFETGRCRLPAVLAMTTPGSRAVWVCGARFAAAHQRDRRLTEMVLIHEALHTLGLGENPPSTHQISERVFERCGH